MAHRKATPAFECAYCGNVTPWPRRFKRNGHSAGFKPRARFCSTRCANFARGRYEDQTTIGFLDKNGYRMIRVGGVTMPEHRFVIQQEIGRKLFPHETVHHKNGDRADNRRENLELWSSRHGRGQRVADKLDFATALLEEYGVAFLQPGTIDHIYGALSMGA